MKILKFGGSSISSSKRKKKVIDIILQLKQNSQEIAVVFSAFGGVTDDLIKTSKEAATKNENYKNHLDKIEIRHLDAVSDLIQIKQRSHVLAQVKVLLNELEDVFHGVYLVKELSSKTLDFILSFGERLSAYIFSEALKDLGIETDYLDTRKLLKTDDHFGAARVKKQTTYQNIKKHFSSNRKLQIITGFIGSTSDMETTTLGRGGSDLTASLFASALQASELEIWTDVNGIMSADPVKVKNAFSIEKMTYVEAMEMSHFGAKVIYPPTIQPVLEQKIPIRIKNTFDPNFKGTIINEKLVQKNRWLIRGISSIEKISLLRVQGSGMIGFTGIAARLFGVLAKEKINIILITQASSEHSICFAVSPQAARKAKLIIEKEFSLEMRANIIDDIIVEKDLSIVAVVGENMRHTPGIASNLFGALGKTGVNVIAIAQGSSELNISIVISNADEVNALNAIHETFFKT